MLAGCNWQVELQQVEHMSDRTLVLVLDCHIDDMALGKFVGDIVSVAEHKTAASLVP